MVLISSRMAFSASPTTWGTGSCQYGAWSSKLEAKIKELYLAEWAPSELGRGWIVLFGLFEVSPQFSKNDNKLQTLLLELLDNVSKALGGCVSVLVVGR